MLPLSTNFIIFKKFTYRFYNSIFIETNCIFFNQRFFHLNNKLSGKLPENWKSWEISNRRSSLIDKKMLKNPEIVQIVNQLRDFVKEQGDFVRKLKEENASQLEIEKAVEELRIRKKNLENKELEFLPNDNIIEKTRFDDLLKRRFYIAQSFEIYGGYAGQYDFGPTGCAIKQNILNLWRNHFIIEEDLLELDCSIITPEPVLKASGHVQKFSDYMVKDIFNGDCFRLDHLIKEHLVNLKKITKDINLNLEYDNLIAKLDSLDINELNDLKKKFEIISPITKNPLSCPIEFNLMFSTNIGPTGNCKGYLRPETAQGIFVNFKRLLELNQGKLPFGAAQIGQAFRNEISPRSGLLRLREFTLAEIEYFINPEEKDYSKFEDVKDLEINLFSAFNQIEGKSYKKMSLDDAIKNKLINSKILGYFIGRIYLFLIKIGINPEKLRFRQHMSNEMAHYAQDCWDAECLIFYGWVECVGCADRSCFDLKQHTNASNTKLVAEKILKNPKIIQELKCVPQKSVLAKTFKKDVELITNKLSNLTEKEILELQEEIKKTGSFILTLEENNFKLNEHFFEIKKVERKIHVEEITPNVIEPSFGIGRILYAVLEHNFKIREDELRTFFSLSPEISPIKCSILPLINNDEFKPFIKKIKKELINYNLSCKVDDGRGKIGKRYSRTDELSVPFNITIDFETLDQPHSVTLRERDTMDQLRIPLDNVCTHILNLSCGKEKWDDLKKKYPSFIFKKNN